MSDLGKDNFEEFLRNSLHDYSSNEAPQWEEMESRLDEAQGGASSGSGIMGSSVAKWIAAIVVVAGLSVLVSNQFTNEGVQNSDDKVSAKDSFMNRIRSLTIADDENGEVNSNGSYEKNAQVSGKSSDKNHGAEVIRKTVAQGQEAQENDAEHIVYSKTVPPETIKKSGPILDMLRGTKFENQSTPDPIAKFSSVDNEGCVPLSVSFKLGSHDVAMKYLWNFGDGAYSTAANPVHLFKETGTYNVGLTVTSLINQKYITEVTEEAVMVYGRPDVDFMIADKDHNEPGNEISFVNYSSNVIDWKWSFGDGTTSRDENPKHTYTADASYEVMLIGKDANGCKDTVSSTIRISGKKLTNKFFAPNAFSPNGDGRNDYFQAKIYASLTLDFEMIIMNRSGSVIFKTDDVNQKWDGRLKSGEIAPQGPYIWQITFKNDKGEHDRQTGIVNLLK